ncbi:MAG: hypothetical protein ACU85E_05820 [Gammaproteobacteria bacterium]
MMKAKMFSTLVVASVISLIFAAEVNSHPRGRFIGRHYSHHPRFSFYLGVPLYSRPYYPYYPYYYPYYPPEIVTVPVEPPVYIERGGPQPSQQLPAGYWYYCSDPEGYYPYVKECPPGWLQVDPVPSAPR